MDEEYELMPQNSLSKLRTDLDNLKQKASSFSGEDLKSSMNKLTENLNSMIQLFNTATDEMKYEEQEAKLLAAKIDPLANKLDTIIDQNEQIARGIVAVADLVKDLKDTKELKPPIKPKHFEHTSLKSPSMMNNDAGMKPIGPPAMPPRPPGMPPMPPGMPPKPMMPPKPSMAQPVEKKGILGMFKK